MKIKLILVLVAMFFFVMSYQFSELTAYLHRTLLEYQLNQNLSKLKKNYSEPLQKVFIYGLTKVKWDNDNQLVINSKDMPVTLSSQEVGVGFIYKLDPKQEYKIVLTTKFSTPFNVRLKKDGKLTWKKMKHGILELTLDGVSELELLFYNRGYFDFRIYSIEIFPWDSHKNLKKEILKDLPQLNSLLPEQKIEVARLLMDWSAKKLIWKGNSESTKNFDPAFMPADLIYFHYFLGGKKAVMCGGAAIFTAKVMQLFDIPAIPVGMGFKEGFLNHVVVVIPIQRGKNWDFYLFDPTYNLFYLNKETKKIATLKELVEWYKADDLFVRAEVVRLPIKERGYLFTNTSNCAPDEVIIKKFVNQYKICRKKRDDFYDESMVIWGIPEAEKHGFFPNDFFDIQLLMKGDFLHANKENFPLIAKEIEKFYQIEVEST